MKSFGFELVTTDCKEFYGKELETTCIEPAFIIVKPITRQIIIDSGRTYIREIDTLYDLIKADVVVKEWENMNYKNQGCYIEDEEDIEADKEVIANYFGYSTFEQFKVREKSKNCKGTIGEAILNIVNELENKQKPFLRIRVLDSIPKKKIESKVSELNKEISKMEFKYRKSFPKEKEKIREELVRLDERLKTYVELLKEE